jgi:hypothetical protein
MRAIHSAVVGSDGKDAYTAHHLRGNFACKQESPEIASALAGFRSTALKLLSCGLENSSELARERSALIR